MVNESLFTLMCAGLIGSMFGLLMAFAGGMIKQRDGGGGIPLRELEQTNPSGESPVTKPRDRSSVPCSTADAPVFPLSDSPR